MKYYYFLYHFFVISDFSCCDSYEDSWKFIKGGKHSLERYSNLRLCFYPLISGALV